MSIDKEKLKALAEAATPGPWRYGKNADDVVADHPAGHADDPHGIDYYGGHLVAESIAASNRAFIAAANPAAVLALIAENERLHKLISWQGDANSEVTISAGQLMKHMDERDQLKAENEALRKNLTYIRDTSDDWHVCEKAADALADDVPDFTPGNGNKARRRAEALGIDYDKTGGKGVI